MANLKFHPAYKVSSTHMISCDSTDQDLTHEILLSKVECQLAEAAGHSGGTTGEVGTYVIAKHRSVIRSPTGRGTKGYVAYNVKNNLLVFIKDYWRPDSAKILTERYQYTHN